MATMDLFIAYEKHGGVERVYIDGHAKPFEIKNDVDFQVDLFKADLSALEIRRVMRYVERCRSTDDFSVFDDSVRPDCAPSRTPISPPAVEDAQRIALAGLFWEWAAMSVRVMAIAAPGIALVLLLKWAVR